MTTEICTVMAFDYGEKRIGIAVGQTLSATAEPISVLRQKNQRIDWNAIEALIDDWRPDQFVIGFPHTADGEEIPIHKAILSFSDELTARYKLPVAFYDEHLSSYMAKQSPTAIKEAKKLANKHKCRPRQTRGKRHRTGLAELDAIAAQMILESWLQSRR